MTDTTVKSLIKSAKDGNVAEMHTQFDAIIKAKIVPLIQQKQREVAKNLFNTEPK